MASVKFKKLPTDVRDAVASAIRTEATVTLTPGQHSTVCQINFNYRVDKTFLLNIEGLLEGSRDDSLMCNVADVKTSSTSTRMPLQRSRMTLHLYGRQWHGPVQIKPQMPSKFVLPRDSSTFNAEGFELSELERCVASAMRSIRFAAFGAAADAGESLRVRHQSGCHTDVNGLVSTVSRRSQGTSGRHRGTSEPPPDAPDGGGNRQRRSSGYQVKSNDTDDSEELLLRPIGVHDLGRADLFVLHPARSHTVPNSGSTMSAPPVRRRTASSGRSQQLPSQHSRGYWTLGKRN